MQEKVEQLKVALATAIDLATAAEVLAWDQETHMPPGGTEGRAKLLSTMSTLAHEYFVTDEIGQLLQDLQAYESQLDYDSDEASLLRVTRREYERERRVPSELVGEIAQTTAIAKMNWIEARQEKEFAIFEPHLDKVIELRQKWASYFEGHASSYDPLLDVYEPGVTSAEVDAVFQAVRPQLVALTEQIAAHQDAVDDSALRQLYDTQDQWDFGMEMATALGYDLQRGRQDHSAHPFAAGFSTGDVRITTRIIAERPTNGWFSTIHEAGHAMHAQGVNEAYNRTPLSQEGSLGVGESQSRLYENIVGRSRPFWQHFFPIVQKRFPAQLDGVDLDYFYKAVNKSEPSLIRIYADEVTYGLHVILRFEIEQAMVAGTVKAADLPDLWNNKMQEYLGITPPDDADGVMQDIHWSMGAIGYFPTYLLGSIFSVQLYRKMQAGLPDVEEQMARGEFADMREWLRANVHTHGVKFGLQEMAARVTGEPLTSEPYIDYLQKKYADIYGL